MRQDVCLLCPIVLMRLKQSDCISNQMNMELAPHDGALFSNQPTTNLLRLRAWDRNSREPPWQKYGKKPQEKSDKAS